MDQQPAVDQEQQAIDRMRREQMIDSFDKMKTLQSLYFEFVKGYPASWRQDYLGIYFVVHILDEAFRVSVFQQGHYCGILLKHADINTDYSLVVVTPVEIFSVDNSVRNLNRMIKVAEQGFDCCQVCAAPVQDSFEKPRGDVVSYHSCQDCFDEFEDELL